MVSAQGRVTVPPWPPALPARQDRERQLPGVPAGIHVSACLKPVPAGGPDFFVVASWTWKKPFLCCLTRGSRESQFFIVLDSRCDIMFSPRAVIRQHAPAFSRQAIQTGTCGCKLARKCLLHISLRSHHRHASLQPCQTIPARWCPLSGIRRLAGRWRRLHLLADSPQNAPDSVTCQRQFRHLQDAQAYAVHKQSDSSAHTDRDQITPE